MPGWHEEGVCNELINGGPEAWVERFHPLSSHLFPLGKRRLTCPPRGETQFLLKSRIGRIKGGMRVFRVGRGGRAPEVSSAGQRRGYKFQDWEA